MKGFDICGGPNLGFSIKLHFRGSNNIDYIGCYRVTCDGDIWSNRSISQNVECR